MRIMRKTANLMPIILKQLKTFTFKEIIPEVTKHFYTMWDAVLEWGGPLIIRAATVALTTICSTGNVAIEWLCSAALELGQDVFFWSMQQLREVGRKLLVDAVRWVAYTADQ